MKRIALMVLALCFTGCACSRKSKVEVYKRALADTNIALTDAQDRAHRYQVAYERLVHEKVKAKHHKK